MKLLAFILIMVLGVWSELALAQKTDIVILKNGDRITGEIKKLEAGLLRFSTDTMGTVSIEWRHILRILSDKSQSLEMRDGSRLYGRLQKLDDEDEVVVQTARGTVNVDFSTIVSAWPVKATFTDRMDLSLSVGFDYKKATETADLNSAIDFRTTNNDRLTEASWRGTNTRREGETDQTRFELKFEHQYLLPDAGIRTWFAGAESNDAQGVNYRVSAGGTFGKYLVKTNNVWFSLQGGLGVNKEVPDEGESEYNLEGVGHMRYRYFRFANPERSLDTTWVVYPSLTDWGRIRSNLRTTFKLELVKDLFWAMELWGNYDNDPISTDEEAEKLDYGITTSIGWSY